MQEMSPHWDELIASAHAASARSYSPYSKLSVGSAVLTRSGATYSGTNVESASFGLSICAERLAIFKAVVDTPAPARADLLTAVVAVDHKGAVVAPCGACRQVIVEFGPSAMVHLPNSVQQAKAILAEPFELTVASSVQESPVDDYSYMARVIGLSEPDATLLMKLQVILRESVVAMYPSELSIEQTRCVLFAREGDELRIPPGFFSNLNRPEERTLAIPLRHGITGAAYSSGEPNYGKPCSDGALHAQTLPLEQQPKVSPDLKWVVAWPLGKPGVVSLDGFDKINDNRMKDIAEAGSLQKIVKRMADLLAGT